MNPTDNSPGKGTPDGLAADPRFKVVERTLKQYQYRADALLEVLHVAQETFGCLSDELMNHVARQLRVPPSRVYGVATFYHFFTLEARGEHSCVVCTGTACYVKRSAEIVARLENEFGVKAGKTTADGKLTLSTVRCLGSCGLAPIVVLDGETMGRCTPDSAATAVRVMLTEKGPAREEAARTGHRRKGEEP